MITPPTVNAATRQQQLLPSTLQHLTAYPPAGASASRKTSGAHKAERIGMQGLMAGSGLALGIDSRGETWLCGVSDFE